jgi:deoxyribodipyrimidine photo-lyase
MSGTTKLRIRECNRQGVNGSGDYILYWMIANRRLHYNFSLDRALEYCAELGKPLVIFEPLRVGYHWASDRMHAFVLEGMADNAKKCEEVGVCYYPHVEAEKDADKGLLAALAEKACVVVTDDYPAFFLPRMIASAAKKLEVLLEAIDSNGLLPMRATDAAAIRAFDFRRTLQKELPKYFREVPKADPLSKVKDAAGAKIPSAVLKTWLAASEKLLAADEGALRALPIDHEVGPGYLPGGHSAAQKHMKEFLAKKLARYAERNEADEDLASGLSPYLHFGHLSAHEIFVELARQEKWKPEKVAVRTNGSKEGWWNMSAAAEGYLDELVTWREVGFNFASHRGDVDEYGSLPEWAKKTLKEHTRDEREHVYTLKEFEEAKTHDQLWNAAQMQLVREGRIQNYLRMLWGKKILEWTKTPEEAAKIMIHLNNKYGLDGRDPNSYCGIFWVLGRYDRPWPERPVFGVIRYMSSENTARKISVKKYMRKYLTEGGPQKRLAF